MDLVGGGADRMVSRGWGAKIEGLVARGSDLTVKTVIRVVLVLFSCLRLWGWRERLGQKRVVGGWGLWRANLVLRIPIGLHLHACSTRLP